MDRLGAGEAQVEVDESSHQELLARECAMLLSSFFDSHYFALVCVSLLTSLHLLPDREVTAPVCLSRLHFPGEKSNVNFGEKKVPSSL